MELLSRKQSLIKIYMEAQVVIYTLILLKRLLKIRFIGNPRSKLSAATAKTRDLEVQEEWSSLMAHSIWD